VSSLTGLAVSDRNRLLVCPLHAIIVVVFVPTIVLAIKGFMLQYYSHWLAEISPLMFLATGSLVIGDAYIATVMCYLLKRSRSGVKQ
jgi:hypothetical protein